MFLLQNVSNSVGLECVDNCNIFATDEKTNFNLNSSDNARVRGRGRGRAKGRGRGRSRGGSAAIAFNAKTEDAEIPPTIFSLPHFQDLLASVDLNLRIAQTEIANVDPSLLGKTFTSGTDALGWGKGRGKSVKTKSIESEVDSPSKAISNTPSKANKMIKTEVKEVSKDEIVKIILFVVLLLTIFQLFFCLFFDMIH